LFSSEPEIVSVSQTVLLIAAVVVIGQSSQMIFMGSLRGAGDTRYTAVISLICIVLIRPILGYIFAYPMALGLIGIWLAFIADQFTRLTLTYRRFSSGKWTKIEL
jgi:Na+-driven multidrug efflux pump